MLSISHIIILHCILYIYSILLQHFEDLKSQVKLVPVHISSKYSKEMAMKSDVVSSCGYMY